MATNLLPRLPRQAFITLLTSLTLYAFPSSAQPLRQLFDYKLADVDGRIDHMSMDRGGHRLFVAALGNGTVEVLDTETGKGIKSILGLKEPQGLLYVAENNSLFVASAGDGTCKIFDASTFELRRTVNLGSDADNIRYDAKAKRVYVGYGGGALAILDLEGNRIGKIDLDAHPESFQLEVDGTRIFVNLPDSHKIAVVNRETRKTIGKWGTGTSFANFPLAFDEANKRLFVVCRVPARLLVIDSESGTQVTAFTTIGDADDLFYDAARKRIYVVGGDGEVVAYEQKDADHYPEIGSVLTAKGARTGYYSAQPARLYVGLRKRENQPALIRVFEIR